MNKRLTLILLAACSGGLAGCELAYNSLQSDQKNSCYELPQPEYEKCLKDASKKYDDYRKEQEQ